MRLECSTSNEKSSSSAEVARFCKLGQEPLPSQGDIDCEEYLIVEQSYQSSANLLLLTIFHDTDDSPSAAHYFRNDESRKGCKIGSHGASVIEIVVVTLESCLEAEDSKRDQRL